VATKASQITKRFAGSRPKHVICLAQDVRALPCQITHSLTGHTGLTGLVTAAGGCERAKHPETCRVTATLIPYRPLIAIEHMPQCEMVFALLLRYPISQQSAAALLQRDTSLSVGPKQAVGMIPGVSVTPTA
jgi:hypothetical protein